MRSYFKDMSTFRLLVLLLALLAVTLALLGLAQGDVDDPVRTRQLMQSMNEATDRFSSRLGAQESLGISLAVQCELMPDPDAEQVNAVLDSLFASAPSYIEGMGLHWGSGDDARLTVVRSAGPNLLATPPPPPERDQVNPRRPSVDRDMAWLLRVDPHRAGEERFSAVFTAALNDPAEGMAFVNADMDWLGGMLTDLAGVGTMPLCLSPGGDILWVDEGVLHFDGDYPDGRFPYGRLIARARAFVRSGGDGRFLHADIMGTGWILLAPTPVTGGPAWPWWLLGACLAALVVDYLLFSPGDGEPSVFRADARRGVLSRTRRLLFTYRIHDPQQARIDSELRVARDIQFRLVPRQLPAPSVWREFDICPSLSPAKEVGGDFYDFVMIDADRMVVAVGDVSGKGVPAALYMAVARTAFRTLVRQASSPGELLTRLNDLLVRDYPSGLYVTLACLFVHLPTGRCEYAIAGHPAPMWFMADRGRAELVENPRETFLGLKANITVPTGEIFLRRGDTLLLYTDGAVEVNDPEGEELDYDGLLRGFLGAAKEDTCAGIIASLQEVVRTHRGNETQEDDMTFMAFRYWGAGGKMAADANRTDHG